MEENKPINNPEVERAEIPPSGGNAKPPNYEQPLNPFSTDETITPAAETPEIINPTSEIKDMEVHHHAHDPAVPHHKKNWKSYFWEFLMLFLAVFCGFFAEYKLEHTIEHQREKRYMKSMVEDLKKDSAFLALSIETLIPYHLQWLDSTVNLLQIPDVKSKEGIRSYVEKLKKYGFYVQYVMKVGQVVLLREVVTAIKVLEKEYHLK